jgi:hypothetical protein
MMCSRIRLPDDLLDMTRMASRLHAAFRAHVRGRSDRISRANVRLWHKADMG